MGILIGCVGRGLSMIGTCMQRGQRVGLAHYNCLILYMELTASNGN